MKNDLAAAKPPINSLQVGLGWDFQNLGGAERVFAELASHLPPQGVQFTGVVPGANDLLEKSHGQMHPTAAMSAGILSRVLGARSVIRRLLADLPIDFIATHFALYSAGVLGSLRSYPHVVHFHGPWAMESAEEGSGRIAVAGRRLLERTVYQTAGRVIVLSEAFAQLANESYGIPFDKIRIVPGSVDIARFSISMSQQDAREHLGWPSDRRILLTVRRLVARMGLNRLISAMASVRSAHPDVLLVIVGTGNQLQSLRSQVVEMHLEECVRFVGFLPDDDLAIAYTAADVNVVPTLAWEGFGLVAAEALAAGTPSMVTPVGGLPEVVSKLSPALLFDSTSVEDIAIGLIEVLSGARSLPTREECREYASENFASTIMAARTASVYRELVPS